MPDDPSDSDDETENAPRFDMNVGRPSGRAATDVGEGSVPDGSEPYLIEVILDREGPESDLGSVLGDVADVDTEFGVMDISPSTAAYEAGFDPETQRTVFARVFIKPEDVDELTAIERVVGEPFPDGQAIEPFDNPIDDDN